MTASLVGQYVACLYGKRKVLPSVGWWVPRPPPCCRKCGQGVCVTERPAPTAEGVASWRARRGLLGIDAGEGPPPDDPPWKQVVWVEVDPRIS